MLSIDQILKVGDKILEERKQQEKLHSCRRFGYNDNGYTYILLENLLDKGRKDVFTKGGGFYDKFLGWHSPRRVDGFLMRRAKMEDIAVFKNGRWWTQKWKVDEFRRKKCEIRLCKRDAGSEFIGELGVNEGTVARVKFLSAKETIYRDRNFGFTNYYGLPYKWEYRFIDTDGNIVVFSTAYYYSDKVKEWFGKGWANMVARAIHHDNTHGTKETWISYPEFTKWGKCKLSEYARIVCPWKKKNESECPEKTAS